MIIRGHERVLVYGITGRQGTFWSERMREYGTGIIGGINPKKAGSGHIGLPVWGSARQAARDVANSATGAGTIDVAVLFVPPMGVKAAVLDAVAAGIARLVILSEHVPVQDVMYFLAAASEAGTAVIGPNTAGLVTPGECFVGFMPAFNTRIFRPGRIGVISRSGSLGTLACLNLVRAGFGISAFIGIGGDPVIGTTTRDALAALDEDDRTDAVALIGEIGGTMEEAAADYARIMQKPVAAFLAGAASPPGRRMGHAGAIVRSGAGGYEAKRNALEAAGVTVTPTPSGLPEALAERLAAR